MSGYYSTKSVEPHYQLMSYHSNLEAMMGHIRKIWVMYQCYFTVLLICSTFGYSTDVYENHVLLCIYASSFHHVWYDLPIIIYHTWYCFMDVPWMSFYAPYSMMLLLNVLLTILIDSFCPSVLFHWKVPLSLPHPVPCPHCHLFCQLSGDGDLCTV